jgi:murein DD-endopeptidase MepM/ murein hydrolase activator NlpD
MRLLSALFVLPFTLLASITAHAQSAHAQSPTVTVTPALVVAGSPEVIRVTAPRDVRVEGDWDGHALAFFPGRTTDVWYALAGMDVERAPGPSTVASTIHVIIHRHGHDNAEEVRETIAIHPAHYRTTSLTVAPKFVEPGPEEMKRIAAESEIKKKVFATTADGPLWSGDFAAPVTARATDSFGTRRMLNGKLAAVHKGMDFRAAMGTVVRAGNAGTVVLAQPLYYEGNCVIVDHGLGLMSLYMHLSRIDVKPEQHVAKGQRLGLSGATGRVTGPHLHWAIRWQGAMLDPAKVLRLKLDNLR